MLPAGIEYDPFSFTLIRKILPRRSLVLAAVRWASNAGLRLVRSSSGEYPADSNGLVSSPVDRYRLPAASKSMSPPAWQQMPRSAGTSRMSTLLDWLSVKSALSVNRESRLTPCHADQLPPVVGASPPGVDSGGA